MSQTLQLLDHRITTVNNVQRPRANHLDGIQTLRVVQDGETIDYLA